MLQFSKAHLNYNNNIDYIFTIQHKALCASAIRIAHVNADPILCISLCWAHVTDHQYNCEIAFKFVSLIITRVPEVLFSMHSELRLLMLVSMYIEAKRFLMSLQSTDSIENEQFTDSVKSPKQVAMVFFVVLGHWPQFEATMRYWKRGQLYKASLHSKIN